ncbi:MAG TPA: hypothetical protein VNF75_01095 [Candidatus Dormibacteraeota bacterium]|nr:hypothetical protein [Candidatus Dormibacteraeota bacterium]
MNHSLAGGAVWAGVAALVMVATSSTPSISNGHGGGTGRRQAASLPQSTPPTHPDATAGQGAPSAAVPSLKSNLAQNPTPRAPQGTSPSLAPNPTQSPTPSGGGAPSLPIRAAFFYPWYPESWYPESHFTPTLGAPYNSSSPSVIQYQIAAMEYAHIEVAIASWWGQGTATDRRIPLLLSASPGTRLRWSLYYEPAPGNQASDLNYIYAEYASNPSYEHVDGKPVLFVYSRSVASCADAANWVNLNAARFYLDLQVFAGYQSCAVQPDQWHQYAPAEREDAQAGHSFSISPGYWLYSSATAGLARDSGAFAQAVRDMVASGQPWQLVTTWNEWGEGTAVEDAVQWGSADPYGLYVDILHNNG